MIKIEIHDDLIDWLLDQQFVGWAREEATAFAQEFISYVMATGAMTVEIPALTAEVERLRAALETLRALARSPAYRVRMTQMAMCGFLDDVKSIISAALDAAAEEAA